MKFSSLRHKVLLVQPTGTASNDMGETVPVYKVYRAGTQVDNSISEEITGNGFKWRKIGTGEEITPSASEYSYWADIKPTAGREYIQAQKIRAETTYNVTMRYIPGVTHDMVILFGSQKFNIESVLEVSSTELKIVCSEVCA